MGVSTRRPGTAAATGTGARRAGTTAPRGPAGPGPNRGGRPRRPGTPDPARPHDWFAERLVQVLSGRSPVHTLLGHVRQEAFEQLVRLADSAPLREDGAPAVVRRVGFCRPAAGVLEVFARIGSADRLRALAFRLEHRRGRWWCSAVELGPGPRRRARVPAGG